MHFDDNRVYHVYNRSNNIIFNSKENYIYFLEKFKHYILPYADVIAWCLMPNHFHFMLIPKSNALDYVNEKNLPNTQMLSKQFGIFLSSYTKAFNKQNGRKGSLFSHNTKAKNLNEIINSEQSNIKKDYIETCFRYIHNNPVKSNLVKKHSDWQFSSFRDYSGLRKGKLVNKILATEIINYDDENFVAWSVGEEIDENLKNIF